MKKSAKIHIWGWIYVELEEGGQWAVEQCEEAGGVKGKRLAWGFNIGGHKGCCVFVGLVLCKKLQTTVVRAISNPEAHSWMLIVSISHRPQQVHSWCDKVIEEGENPWENGFAEFKVGEGASNGWGGDKAQ